MLKVIVNMHHIFEYYDNGCHIFLYWYSNIAMMIMVLWAWMGQVNPYAALVADLTITKWWNKSWEMSETLKKWLLIWDYSARAIQWIPTWQGLYSFQTFLHSCALGESSFSIGRVKGIRQYLYTASCKLHSSYLSRQRSGKAWLFKEYLHDMIKVFLGKYVKGEMLNKNQLTTFFQIFIEFMLDYQVALIWENHNIRTWRISGIRWLSQGHCS